MRFPKLFSARRSCHRSRTQSGFTIIESLVAMVVIAVLMASIAPVIALSVATRVQARRVELATQAARSYIDLVTINPDMRPVFANATNQTVLVSAATNNFFLNAVNPPPPSTGPLNCPTSDAYCTTPRTLYCVNFDSTPGCSINSPRDMLINAVRTTTVTTGIPTALPADPPPKGNIAPPSGSAPANNPDDYSRGYRLLVRVYRAAAFSRGLGLQRSAVAGKQATFGGGIGVGDRGRPLVEMTTDIIPIAPPTGSNPNGFGDACKRLQSSTGTFNATTNPNGVSACQPSL